MEGTIWEYKATLEKGELDGKKKAKTEGYFRTEGEGIFAVERRIKLPSGKQIRKLIDSIRSGDLKPIELPGGKPKRIGDYKISRTGRLTLKFDDEGDEIKGKGLFGTMILRKKKEQRGVYIGDYREKEGKKTVRTWQVTVRGVED